MTPEDIAPLDVYLDGLASALYFAVNPQNPALCAWLTQVQCQLHIRAMEARELQKASKALDELAEESRQDEMRQFWDIPELQHPPSTIQPILQGAMSAAMQAREDLERVVREHATHNKDQ